METVRIAGREFRPVVDSTFQHDAWTVQQLDRSGMRSVVMLEDETADEFVQRMLTQLMASGATFDLLAGLLMPAELSGKDWTPEIAAQTSKLFAQSTGEDKCILRTQVAGAMEVFLANGLLSSIRSRKSSARTIVNHIIHPNQTAEATEASADGLL